MVDRYYASPPVRPRRPPTVLAGAIVQFFLGLATLAIAVVAAVAILDNPGFGRTDDALLTAGALVVGVMFLAFGVGTLLGSNAVRIATMILDVVVMLLLLAYMILLVDAVSDGSGPLLVQAVFLALLLMIEGATALAVIMLTRPSANDYFNPGRP